jgi:putative ABC transport system permease protein
VRNQAQIKAFSLEIFENTFRVTGALNVLTLGVASLALLTSLLTLSSLRLPQVAPVWALGTSRARLARTEVWRLMLLALLTFVLAVPGGPWPCVDPAGGGERGGLRLAPADADLPGRGAAPPDPRPHRGGHRGGIPALRLWRMPPARMLQVFSQER